MNTASYRRRVAIVDAVTKLLLRGRKRTRVKNPRSPVMVNLGSGLAAAPGWINIEGSLHAWAPRVPKHLRRVLYRLSGSSSTFSLSEYERIMRTCEFLPHDLRFGIPLPDESVEHIYCSHFLETMYIDEAEALLEDCFRVLQPGGRLRIGIRDLEATLRAFLQGHRRSTIEVLYGVSSDPTYLNAHRSGYDFELLREVLEEVGFQTIVRCQAFEGRMPDLNHLDTQPDRTIFVEALRPA